MKRGMMIGAAVGVAALLLGLNNPSPAEFTGLVLAAGGYHAETANPFAAMGEEMGKQRIEASLIRTNLGVASIYELPGEPVRFLAVGGRIIPLKS